MMKRKNLLQLLSLLMSVGLTFLISSCMFSVRLSDGSVRMASVSDQEIMRFMNRMGTLTERLLEETRNHGEDGLARVVTEMRMICNDMARQMGQNPATPVDVDKLELKVKAFDLQMSNRFKSAPGAPGIKSIETLFQQLQSEVNRFKTLVERSVWH
ncbi:hypothetical protein HY229_05935 [Candidatus Acetothermia bacterium]|nr:hypothetical protein [Candidatus Acetothermia bacterium]MBI3643622.1 hypothetical protein [Candidatus Acetothermia bacterium]